MLERVFLFLNKWPAMSFVPFVPNYKTRQFWDKIAYLVVVAVVVVVVVVEFIRHYYINTITMKVQNYTKCQGVPNKP